MTGRMQTGPEDFLGRVVPALKPVSSSVTQRGKCLPTFQSSVACRDGGVFRVLNANRPITSLPSVACPGFATCT